MLAEGTLKATVADASGSERSNNQKSKKARCFKQRAFLSGAEGIRTNAKTTGNTAFLEKGGAESGALEVLELWPHLSLSQAEAIVRIVREGL